MKINTQRTTALGQKYTHTQSPIFRDTGWPVAYIEDIDVGILESFGYNNEAASTYNEVIQKIHDYLMDLDSRLQNLEGTNSGTVRVTFVGNATGVTSPEQRVLSKGSEIGTLPTLTQDGFTFVGWFTELTNGEQIDATYKVYNNITVYAHWIQNSVTTYTVTFINEGATVSTRQVNAGSTLGSLPSVSKSNYTLLGWFNTAASTGGVQYTSSSTINSNITLYARWTQTTPTTYTVTFINEGATISTRQVNAGSTLESLPSVSKSNYTLVGWFNTSASTGGTQYTSSSTINSNITLYARWERKQYTLTFTYTGLDSNSAQRYTINAGESFTIIDVPSTWSDPYTGSNTSNGWKIGNTLYSSGQSITPTSSMSFFVNWVNNNSNNYYLGLTNINKTVWTESDLNAYSASPLTELTTPGITGDNPFIILIHPESWGTLDSVTLNGLTGSPWSYNHGWITSLPAGYKACVARIDGEEHITNMTWI